MKYITFERPVLMPNVCYYATVDENTLALIDIIYVNDITGELLFYPDAGLKINEGKVMSDKGIYPYKEISKIEFLKILEVI